MAKLNLPNESLTDNNLTAEANYLVTLYSTKPRTNSGVASFVSQTSGITYSTETSMDGLYSSQGQEGLLAILQEALKDYQFTAEDYNIINGNITALTVQVENNQTTATTNITQLKEQLARNSYDDYQLWLELYYKGYISQVEAGNAKAIIFDGFMDTANVDTLNSTVTVDTVNKKVTLKNADIISLVGDHTFSVLGLSRKVAQTFKMKNTTKISKVYVKVDASGVTNNPFYAEIIAVDTYGLPYQTTSYGQASASTNIPTLLAFDFSSLNIILDEGTTYAVVVSLPNETNYDQGYIYYSNNVAYANYLDGQFYYTDDGGTTWNVFGYDMNFKIEFEYTSPSTLVTDAKALPFTPVSLSLYQSVKKPEGTTITTTVSADDGVHYETPTLVTSRPDPKFTGYVEEEYSLTIANVGQSVKLKSILTGVNRDEVEIKRYGVIML